MYRYVRTFFVLVCVLGLATLVLSRAGSVSADGPGQTNPDSSANYCDSNLACNPAIPPARRFALAGPSAALMDSPVVGESNKQPETYGVDYFGYFWNDRYQPYAWIDATKGTNTGMKGSSYNQKVGPIALPFAFKYYENTYSSLYIAAGGLVAFDAPAFVPAQGLVPNVAAPNNFIAPYWSPFELGSIGKSGRVFYSSGGVAPDRYFVVEWNGVHGGPSTDSTGGNDTFKFEVILKENGNVVFQYANMSYNGTYWCGTAGMENGSGLGGFTSLGYCKTASAMKAVTINRPTPAARFQVLPSVQGRVGAPGSTVVYHVTIRNIGDLGTDTFNLDPYGLPIELDEADGITPLTDTDTDDHSDVDTGPLAANASKTIVVKVPIPADAAVGASFASGVSIASSMNGDVAGSVPLPVTVAPDFVQAYHTYDDGAMTLDFIRNDIENIVKVTPDNYNAAYPGILALPNGNYIYAWDKQHCLNVKCSREAQELEFTLRDSAGAQVREIQKVKNLGSPKKSTYDYSYGMDATSDSSIGIAWVEEIDDATGKANQNIWFAAINASGDTVVAPQKLTRNKSWGNSSIPGVPFFYNARVAATADNHFVVVWQQEVLQNNLWDSEIEYQVLDSSGHTVHPATQFTKGKAGAGYYSPTALTLANGNVLLAFTKIAKQPQEVYIGGIGSDGNVVLGVTNLTNDGGNPVQDWYYLDAARLSNGNVMLGWTGYHEGRPTVRYSILDSAFNRLTAPNFLDNANSPLGDGPVSITADSNGGAIFTTHDYNSSYRHNLYYALIGSDGSRKTAPMAFRQSDSYITTGFGGEGNAK